MTATTSFHVPVLAPVIAAFAAGARRAVDGTAGGGGHAELLLQVGARVLAVDRDPDAVAVTRERLGPAADAVLQGSFADPSVLSAIHAFRPDLVLLDLGVSSRQLDTDARGFSFRRGVPLDMRMDPAAGHPTARDLLNRLPERDLLRLFRENADEPRARRLARAIGTRRGRRPFTTSDDLVAAIRSALGPGAGPPDFARLFQAVRMDVNQERDQLKDALPQLLDALVPGGRLLVIAYHSGEDRLVKHVFREWARACVCPPRQPMCTCRGSPLGTLDPPRAIRPAAAETDANPRARSARLRGFRKANG